MAFIKVVYFDEESASDLLDMTAGGKEVVSKENVRERSAEVEARLGASLLAKLSFMPFFGASAEASAAASASAAGRSIFHKTLSNTILTDYLQQADGFGGVETFEGVRLSARRQSAAYMKMYTPYMAVLKTDDLPVNLAVFDEALSRAKGYYELVGEREGAAKIVLRFNLLAFRNNYGLADLTRMDLLFHGVRVGRIAESSLTMQAEMSPATDDPVSFGELVDDEPSSKDELLDVYDVIFAGVNG